MTTATAQLTTATAQRHLLLNMTANGSLGPEGEDLLIVQRGRIPTPRTPTAGATSTACGGRPTSARPST